MRAITRHVWQKVMANTLGRFFISDVGKSMRARVAELGAPVRRPEVRIAIVAHIYYLDLALEIIALRDIFPDTVPVHLTVPREKAADLARIVNDLPDVTLHPYENRGRDIAPFLALLESGTLDRFDAVLKLHTKRSPHLIDGEIRRKLLFAMLCGERHATYRALAAFEDKTTGMVGWRDCFRSDPPYWMANEANVRLLCSRMGADDVVRLGFFEGSMFWFRPSALEALRELRIPSEEFEPEAAQLDGTLHHAIERCFTIAAWAKGFSVRDLRGRRL